MPNKDGEQVLFGQDPGLAEEGHYAAVITRPRGAISTCDSQQNAQSVNRSARKGHLEAMREITQGIVVKATW